MPPRKLYIVSGVQCIAEPPVLMGSGICSDKKYCQCTCRIHQPYAFAVTRQLFSIFIVFLDAGAGCAHLIAVIDWGVGGVQTVSRSYIFVGMFLFRGNNRYLPIRVSTGIVAIETGDLYVGFWMCADVVMMPGPREMQI